MIKPLGDRIEFLEGQTEALHNEILRLNRELSKAYAVVNAARELSERLHGIYGDPEYFEPELEKLKPLDDALATYDTAEPSHTGHRDGCDCGRD